MKKLHFLFVLITLLSFTTVCTAQRQKRRKANETAVPYTGPEVPVRRPHDALADSTDEWITMDDNWAKIVYRDLEINRTAPNSSLLHLHDTAGTEITLPKVIYNGIRDNRIISLADTTWAEQRINKDSLLNSLKWLNEPLPDSVRSYRLLIKEKWMFDRVEGKMTVQIQWIGFERSVDDSSAKRNPVCWLKYSLLTPILSHYTLEQTKKKSSPLTCREYFEARMFSSTIYKVGEYAK